MTAPRPTRGWLAARAAALTAALALVVTSCGAAPSAPPPKTSRISLSSCTVEGRAARCGRLLVPENRISGTGRRIGLRVVVLPAAGSHPAPDPVVYLAGGPGYAASDFVGEQAPVFANLNRDRAVVFVDQRGMGGSNELACPTRPPGSDLSDPTQLGPYVRSCLPDLNGDPRFYTTAMAADDVADVLRGLGYARANLYGGSYGATIAQVFMRRHPDMVRTATLQGGTLLDIPLSEVQPRTSQAALDEVFARCRADPACNAAFPDPAGDLSVLMRQLEDSPVTLPADRSPTHEAITLTPVFLGGAVNELLKSTDTAVQVPRIIHNFAVSQDRPGLLAAYAAQMSTLTEGVGKFLVATYIIRCDEPWARFSPDNLAKDSPDSYYLPAAEENARYYQAACPLFPRAGAAADYGPSVTSKAPVLILNGSADPQDPPSSMAGAQRIWPNSRQLIEPGQAHSLSSWQCNQSIVDSFVIHASSRIDTSCLAGVPLPPFPT